MTTPVQAVVVDTNWVNPGNPSVSGTFSGNVTAGNSIWVGVSGYGLPPPYTCTDSLGNDYTLIGSIEDPDHGIYTLHFLAPYIRTGGPCTVTVSFNGASYITPPLYAIEWPGSWIVDVHSELYQATASTAINATAITTTQNGDVVIGIAQDGNGAETFTINSPFAADVAGVGNMYELSYTQPAKGTITPSITSSAATWYNFLTVALKAALTPAAGSLGLQGYAPSVTIAAASLRPNPGSLGLQGNAGTAIVNRTLQAGTGSLAAQGYAPQAGTNTASPLPGTLGLLGYAPSVVMPLAVQPNTGNLTAGGQAPTVSTNGRIPNTGSLALQGYAPVLTQTLLLTPNTGALATRGFAPALAGAAPRFAYFAGMHFHNAMTSHTDDPLYRFGNARIWDFNAWFLWQKWTGVGAYSYSSLDSALAYMRSKWNAQACLVFSGVPTWASARPTEADSQYFVNGRKAGPVQTTAGLAQYQQMCIDVITHFRKYLWAVEGENEPYDGVDYTMFGQPKPGGGTYSEADTAFSTMTPTNLANVQKQLYLAAKSVDPKLLVLSAAMVYIGSNDFGVPPASNDGVYLSAYLNAMTSQGEHIWQFFDVLAVHGYQYSSNLCRADLGIGSGPIGGANFDYEAWLARIRALATAAGVPTSVPIADTEHGWGSWGGASYTEFNSLNGGTTNSTQKGRVMYLTAMAARKAGVQTLAWYAHDDSVSYIGIPDQDTSLVSGGARTISGWFDQLYLDFSVPNDSPITPDPGILTAAGQPALIPYSTIIPGTGSLGAQGYAPIIGVPLAPQPNTGSLTATGAAPILGTLTAPGTGTLTATGQTGPFVVIGLGPLTGAVSAIGYAPGLQTVIVPNAGVMAATGAAGGIAVQIVPSAGALTAAGQASTILQIGAIMPAAGSAGFTGFAPALTFGLAPNPGTLTAAGQAPLTGRSITPNAGTLTMTGYPVQGFNVVPLRVTPNAGALATAGAAPALSSAPAADGGGPFDESDGILTIWDA